MNFAVRAAVTAFAVLAFTRAVLADTPPPDKIPEPTKPIYIAMLYEKFKHPLGDKPDFEELVRNSPAYDDAQLFERPNMVVKGSKDLKTTYDRLVATDPIVVQVNAHISAYNAKAQGFQVQNFMGRAHFDYAYLGQDYALVPDGINKYQWLTVPPDKQAEIMKESDNGTDAHMIVTLLPNIADRKPFDMNGKKFLLIMGSISKIEMWSHDGSHIVWNNQTVSAPTTGGDGKILNLFNH